MQPHHNGSIEQLEKRLVELMRSFGSVAVAFSGGVDSAVVAKAAQLGCVKKAVAVTAVSPSLASGELDIARACCESIGIRHEVITTDEFQVSGYQENAGDRCYYCKTELYEQLDKLIPRLGVKVVCNGANADDQGDHRPGMLAAKERDIRSPLLELGMTKSDVRALAKHWNLQVWDKPAMPCLSSRIAYGVEVTPERVRMVDQAESFLKEAFNIMELRVRCEANELARIEVPINQIPLLCEPDHREQLTKKLKQIGFRYITIDLEGFRSGSLNESLPIVELQFDNESLPNFTE